MGNNNDGSLVVAAVIAGTAVALNQLCTQFFDRKKEKETTQALHVQRLETSAQQLIQAVQERNAAIEELQQRIAAMTPKGILSKSQRTPPPDIFVPSEEDDA